MSKEEVFQFLMEHARPYCREDYFKEKFPDFYSILMELSFPPDFSFQQKIYHYFKDDLELKLGYCIVCGNKCKFLDFKRGYAVHCCIECVNKDKSVREKRKQTCMERYNVENPFQSEEKKDKIKETLMKRYGGDHPMHCKKIVEKLQETNMEKYGNVCSLHGEEVAELVKKNNMKKYGVENAGGSKESLEKIKETNNKKYGCDYYFNSQDYKDRYYNEILPKYEQTCEYRYGARNFSSSEEYRERQSDIVKKIYDVKKENDSLGKKSQIEIDFEQYLKDNNIEYEYQYMSEQYPFKCDFYIVRYDLYIEIQGFWCHGKHPFDENNDDDKKLLTKWEEKALTNNQYETAIDVWTRRDPMKRKVAKDNNLNWMEIFSIDIDVVIQSYINTISKL